MTKSVKIVEKIRTNTRGFHLTTTNYTDVLKLDQSDQVQYLQNLSH